MGLDPAILRITLHSEPTEQDYQHAHRAHSAWAQLDLRRRREYFVLYWLVIFAIAGIAIFLMNSRGYGFRPWSINPMWVVALAGFVPFILLTLIVLYKLRGPQGKGPEGIIEQPIGLTGVPARTKHKSPSRGIAVWMVFAILTIALYAIQRERAAPSFPPPSNLAADPTQVIVPSPLEVPGGWILFGSALVLAVTLQWFVKVAGPSSRSAVKNFPALLLPRDWEITEHELIERGPLLESRMKWAYIVKFLETPKVIMLYPNNATFYLIPKSAFTTELELAQFLGILMRKVSCGITQPRATIGFPVKLIGGDPLPGQGSA